MFGEKRFTNSLSSSIQLGFQALWVLQHMHVALGYTACWHMRSVQCFLVNNSGGVCTPHFIAIVHLPSSPQHPPSRIEALLPCSLFPPHTCSLPILHLFLPPPPLYSVCPTLPCLLHMFDPLLLSRPCSHPHSIHPAILFIPTTIYLSSNSN